jgi:hypothetical protein
MMHRGFVPSGTTVKCTRDDTPMGTYRVACTATDVFGRSATCTFDATPSPVGPAMIALLLLLAAQVLFGSRISIASQRAIGYLRSAIAKVCRASQKRCRLCNVCPLSMLEQ